MYPFILLSFIRTKEEKSKRSPLTSESYLCLHRGESPAGSLVSPVLDSTNYHSWNRSMFIAMSAKNKMALLLSLTRTILYTKFGQDAMVVSWIIH